MSYSGGSLAVIAQSIENTFNVAVYFAAGDSLQTVLGTNYISDGQKRGLKVGDFVYILFGTDSSAYTLSQAVVTAAQATTSGYGVSLTAVTSTTGTGVALSNTAISTIGAGTLTAAGIVGGVITRSGSTAAFTDTTATATQIVAAMVGKTVGNAWILRLVNTTAYPETVAGGTGVTVSGSAVVAPLSWNEYLVTYSASTPAVTMYGLSSGQIVAQPPAKYVTAAGQSTTLTAAQCSGAALTVYDNTGTTPANLQFPAATDLVAAIPNAAIGYSYELRIRNSSGSANTATITTNTGITLTGTMTIAQSVTRYFIVTLTSLSAVTVQSVGISAAGA